MVDSSKSFNDVPGLAASFESDSTIGNPIKKKHTNENSKLPIDLYFAETTEGKVLFIGGYMEIYVSIDDIDRKFAEIVGREVYTFGIFEMRIWNEEPADSASAKPDYITRYMFPSQFRTIPSVIVRRSVSVGGQPESPHMVFGYKKNDIFIKNLVLAKSSAIVKKFIDTIFGAFLTKIVGYDDLVSMTLDCASLNGVSFDLNATTLEMVFAAQARYAQDLTIPYRVYINRRKSDTPLTGSELAFVKITELPHIESTFTSFSFQNIDYSITSSAKRNRTKQKQSESSIEKIIKY